MILSDELNHASIIDAVRLARPARKAVYKHSDMDDLRDATRGVRARQRALVITDGVFSMEGDLAKLPESSSSPASTTHRRRRRLARHRRARRDRPRDRGAFGLLGEVDVITSTLGKALGGAAGGYVAASEEVCDILAQRSRPQLFSNALPPTVACSALEAVRVLRREPERVAKLRESTSAFRGGCASSGSSRSTARPRSSRSSSARPPSRSVLSGACSRRASSSPASATRSSRRGPHASAFRCPRRSSPSTSTARSRVREGRPRAGAYLVPRPAIHAGFRPASTLRAAASSVAPIESSIGAPCVLASLGADDPEARRHYWTGH